MVEDRMTQPKKPRKPKDDAAHAKRGPGRPAKAPNPAKAAPCPPVDAKAAEEADLVAVNRLVKGLMDWYLMKINGDPMMEGFDILMNVEGPGGVTGHKYVLGGYDESMPRLRQDLETQHADCLRYACAWRGWWERPDGQKFDGAILMVESRHLKPVIAGLAIGPDGSGRKVLAGPLQVLNVADWSLLHRG